MANKRSEHIESTGRAAGKLEMDWGVAVTADEIEMFGTPAQKTALAAEEAELELVRVRLQGGR